LWNEGCLSHIRRSDSARRWAAALIYSPLPKWCEISCGLARRLLLGKRRLVQALRTLLATSASLLAKKPAPPTDNTRMRRAYKRTTSSAPSINNRIGGTNTTGPPARMAAGPGRGHNNTLKGNTARKAGGGLVGGCCGRLPHQEWSTAWPERAHARTWVLGFLLRGGRRLLL